MDKDKFRDIRFDFFESLQWKGSIILYLFSLILIIMHIFTPVAFISLVLKTGFGKKVKPVLLVDIWILLALALQVLALNCWADLSAGVRTFLMGFSIYFLFDSFCATMRDVILSPNIYAGALRVYNRQRWLFLTFLTAIQVVLSFAVIMLYYGTEFTETVTEPMRAVYLSSVTFISLGYGDILPRQDSSIGQMIVISELFFFILLLALKVPLAVGMVRVSDFDEENPDR